MCHVIRKTEMNQGQKALDQGLEKLKLKTLEMS